jgi:hypothetical protein
MWKTVGILSHVYKRKAREIVENAQKRKNNKKQLATKAYMRYNI